MSNFSLGKIGGHKAHSYNTRWALNKLLCQKYRHKLIKLSELKKRQLEKSFFALTLTGSHNTRFAVRTYSLRHNVRMTLWGYLRFTFRTKYILRILIGLVVSFQNL